MKHKIFLLIEIVCFLITYLNNIFNIYITKEDHNILINIKDILR